MSKPNFFIVGAPKCGTTAMSRYLSEHKNVFISHPKEPHYFATDMPNKRYVQSIDEYLRLFDGASKQHTAVGEASVWYLYSDVALKNIREFDPNAKIIAMLRNPVDLVYSSHSQSLHSNTEDEQNFMLAWKLIVDRKDGRSIPKHVNEVKLLYYDEIAKLGDQIEKLFSIFPKEQVKIIFFDDFIKETRLVYEEVLDFLSLPRDGRSEFPVINKNKRHKNRLIASMTQSPPKSLVDLALRLKRVFGIQRLGIISKLRSINEEEVAREKLEKKLAEEVIEVYRDDIMKLARLTGRDLHSWLEYRNGN